MPLEKQETFLGPTPADKDGHRPLEAVIFEGGGTKGMVYAGCLSRLEEFEILKNVKFFAGSSAGAQTAALFAAGYSGKELDKIMGNAPWDRLLDGNEGCCGCFAGLHRLRHCKGYYKGDFLEEYLDDLLAKKLGKKQITFKEFHDLTGKTLRLGVCNLATRAFGFLDQESSPNVAISHACRASSSIPFVFVPKVIEIKGKHIHFVDGGVQGNLPATAFGLKTGIAFHLMPGPQFEEAVHSNQKPKPQPPKTFLGFTEAVLDMLMNHVNPESAEEIQAHTQMDRAAVLSEQGMHLIRINTQHHAVLETTLTEEQKKDLIALGTEAANHYLKTRGLIKEDGLAA
jgi:predicted acylesterase/phospholipase RssA